MSVARTSLALFVFGLGCGPAAPGDWMIGTFSTHDAPGIVQPSSMSRYEFKKDGLVVKTFVQACGAVETEYQARWEPRDEDTITVVPLDEEEAGEDYHPPFGGEAVIRHVERCTEGGTERIEVQTGGPDSPPVYSGLARGAICVRPPPPELVGNDCEAYWCDEPPPPCPYDELYVPP